MTDTSQTVRKINASLRSIDHHYREAYERTLADADLIYTLSFQRQPMAFCVMPCGPKGMTLDLLPWTGGDRLYLPTHLGHPGTRATTSNPSALARELEKSSTLIDADSARMAWKCLAALVAKAERSNGKEETIVSVHNIHGTFGQLYHRHGEQFRPVLRTDFKTYQTYDELSERLHCDLLDV